MTSKDENTAGDSARGPAVVTYDDAPIEMKALIGATTNAGYPSAPRS